MILRDTGEDPLITSLYSIVVAIWHPRFARHAACSRTLPSRSHQIATCEPHKLTSICGSDLRASVSSTPSAAPKLLQPHRVLSATSRGQEEMSGQVVRDLFADLGALFCRVPVVHAAVNASIEHFVKRLREATERAHGIC